MKSNQKGLTLIELVVVLLMMSIVMSTLMFGHQMAKEIAFKAKINEIAYAIESTKVHAVATGKNFNILCLEDRIVFKELPEKTIYRISLDDEMCVDVKSRYKYYRFHGSMAPVGAFTISLNHESLGKRARITVGVATGKVRIYYETL